MIRTRCVLAHHVHDRNGTSRSTAMISLDFNGALCIYHASFKFHDDAMVLVSRLVVRWFLSILIHIAYLRIFVLQMRLVAIIAAREWSSHPC